MAAFGSTIFSDVETKNVLIGKVVMVMTKTDENTVNWIFFMVSDGKSKPFTIQQQNRSLSLTLLLIKFIQTSTLYL